MTFSGIFNTTSAFTNCNDCRNNRIITKSTLSIDGSFDDGLSGGDASGTNDGSLNDNSGDQGAGDDGSGDQGAGDDGSGDQGAGDDGSGDQGAGDDGSGDDVGPGTNTDNEACAKNMEALAIEKSFLACKINTAISKANSVINAYLRLQSRLESLLSTMGRAPVCTNLGYNIGEFERDHSIAANIENLEDFVEDMNNLLEDLDDIKLDCNNCDDPAALEAALAAVREIAANFDNTVQDFKDEMAEIENRYSRFITRLQQVINLHTITIQGIMIECGVGFRRARFMARARRRVIRAIRNLSRFKDRLDKRIADIGFGSDDCVKAQPSDKAPAALICLSI